MKRALGKEVGKFYFTKLDGTVLYTTAIVSTVIFPREHYHITYAPYEVVIESIDGLFFSVAKKEETIFGASAESTITIDNAEWTADAYPLIRATFLSAALATQLTISAGGVTITINDAISLWDAYEIDTKNVKVTKNGTQQIDYTGALHQLRVEPWEDTIVIDANGTRSADLSVIREDAHT